MTDKSDEQNKEKLKSLEGILFEYIYSGSLEKKYFFFKELKPNSKKPLTVDIYSFNL